MFSAIADVLNLIVQPCYALTGNWWAAIALFTLITKVILIPLSLWVQKNSIVMVKVMPDLNRLKVKYYGDRETIGELQSKLNKEHGYHPLLSLIPLAVQVIILFGLVDVIHGITDGGVAGTEILGMVPIADGGPSLAMPVLAGLSAVLMGFAQNRINPLQREQSRAEKNATNALSIGLSLFLGFFVATGMAFYWVISNLSAILVQAVCNIVIKPRKYIDYEDLEESRKELEVLNALGAKRGFIARLRDPLIKRERKDIKRFYNVVGKHLVFYSEGSGFYKYFRGAIEWLLQNSDLPIHYITKDPDDQIFELAKGNPRIIPYYIGEQRLITVMMKMDADMVITTLGDLDVYYIKRSYVRRDIEYVYMFHHMTSTGPTSHKEEYMNYDTLLCVGEEQIVEQRRFEELYADEGARKKNLIPVGYDLLDREIADYEANHASKADRAGKKPTVLIGPSWQVDNLCDSCIDVLIGNLLGHGWRIIVRPHPEYTKRYRPRWDAILERWKHVPEDELFFEKDFSSNDAIVESDVLITDWSSVAFEFAFSTKKPCIFVNTTMKLNNPNYAEFAPNPSDISLRDRVGVSFEPDDLDGVADQVRDMIEHPDRWHDRIAGIVEESVFNLGHGGQAAGEYILNRLLELQAAKDGAASDAAAGKKGVEDAA
ncbi:YidC/Oxa1 family membrane protein insertase [Curtanaerobium respiraculi]|uniref:YidC/Oxa1 family membrane protein insertase n=1 Tax=Curtanaerobium respiraculi TaxID=2949669 RepID=UPI0024B3A809|nr:YidC/Oxa1 family membrane protein insertase [Curtanaerobium respiraculi]